jgi:uncharacterized protein YqeY
MNEAANSAFSLGQIRDLAVGQDAVTELFNSPVVSTALGKTPTTKEMGQVMKAVQTKLQAASLRAEGRAVSEMVKKALAG